MKLEKIATPSVVVLSPSDTLNRAIQQMWCLNTKHLPVMEHGLPVGMVSEHDLLLHVCQDSYVTHELTHRRIEPVTGASRVDDVMSSPIISLSPDDPVEKAARLMLSEEIRAIPLVSSNSMVGIVTETDILKCYFDDRCLVLGPPLRQSSVVDHMIVHVFSVGPNDLKPTVIRLMRDKHVRHVPVLQDKKLIGIITERDVLRGHAQECDHPQLSVSDLQADQHSHVCDIMSADLEVVTLSATLCDAARKMVANKIGCLPIVDDQQLTGVITETDLVRAFVHSYE